MRFLSSFLLSLALGARLVSSLMAQDREVKQPKPADMGVINDIDVTVTDLTEEKLNHPPKREIKFERLDEPLKWKLAKADPKLLELKFIAKFELTTPQRVRQSSAFPRDENGRITRLAFLGPYLLINPESAGGAGGSTVNSFQEMIKGMPAKDSPAKDERDFYSDSKSIDNMLVLTPLSNQTLPPSSRGWGVTVFGASPEQVTLRASALLTLLDHGVCRPMQLSILKKREPLCTQLREQRRALEVQKQLPDALERELKSYVDFTPDMLPNLRVQQLQLEVDLAGVKARIAACEKLLAQPALKPERRSQIEDVKVSAEIEFSGFEARRAKLVEFIVKVKNKLELLGKLNVSQGQQANAIGKIAYFEGQIREVDEAIRLWAPLPLVDNKITIQPLEWTE